jgi:hypothetical protein
MSAAIFTITPRRRPATLERRVGQYAARPIASVNPAGRSTRALFAKYLSAHPNAGARAPNIVNCDAAPRDVLCKASSG